MPEHLHIVALDAPSPPDYGGVFDLYYKIPALAEKGIRIHLHYFDYKKGRSANGLESFCASIHKYNRSSFLSSLVSLQPYIVSSRVNEDLIRNLNSDDAPVLIEGIHSAGILPYLKKSKKAILRLHNDEAVYYKNLFRTEKSLYRKLYYGYEYKALERFQSKLDKEISVASVSASDADNFRCKYHFHNTYFLPCFLPWRDVISPIGNGSYCLYHGNLEVSENIQAVKWLVEKVFSGLAFPFIVAGKGADLLKGKQVVSKNVQLISNPSDQQLSELIQNAQINILPSFNETGVKLKLLHALYEGRFCITNNSGIRGSGITTGVHIADAAEIMTSLIRDLFNKPFTQTDIELRKRTLGLYNNAVNADKLISLL